MSDEVMVRVSELRAAAEQLGQSAQLLRQSMARAQAQMADLPAPILGGWALDRLDDLHRRLAQAVEGVEDANGRGLTIPLGVLWNRLGAPVLRPAAAEAMVAPPAYTLGRYISRRNRPLYDAMLSAEATVAHSATRAADLRAERERVLADYTALGHRMALAGQAVGASQVAAFDGQLAHLDQRIAQAEADGRAAQAEADQLRERLLRVTPPDTADPALLRGLEGAQSHPAILANTRDCVNYVASRVPIPFELAADAHLWDERASEWARFGIGSGEVPLPGAVLVMERDHPFASDDYGHVMLVESVGSDGAVWVTDNNNPTPVRLSDLTTETQGERLTYLYLPWYTRAG
jgi:hypothetical protein